MELNWYIAFDEIEPTDIGAKYEPSFQNRREIHY